MNNKAAKKLRRLSVALAAGSGKTIDDAERIYKNLKTVYKENKNWKWNEKIPISNSLINSFRLFVSESLQEGTLFKKNTNIKTENNNNLNQKEMQSPTPAPPVKKRGSYKKTTKPKVAIEKPKTQIVFSDPIKKVGLIRSFWRWLY